MEEKLQELRNSMDKTVYKEVVVNNDERMKILNRINKIKKSKRNIFMNTLSYSVCFVLFLGIGVYSFQNMLGFQLENPQTSDNTSGALGEDDKDLDESKVESNFEYIILNDYYYNKIDQSISPEEIDGQISEVKRTGNWAIKRNGDSNEVPPGPIYSIKGKDSNEFIASKGILYVDGKNIENFIIFKKGQPVEKGIDLEQILSAKGDTYEINIALKNINNRVNGLYTFKETDRVILDGVSYNPGTSNSIRFIYRVPESDMIGLEGEKYDGILFLDIYKENSIPNNSRFSKDRYIDKKTKKENSLINERIKLEWEEPTLLKSFTINGITWAYYKDNLWKYYNDTSRNENVLLGKKDGIVYEITTQGKFTIEQLQELLKYYKEE